MARDSLSSTASRKSDSLWNSDLQFVDDVSSRKLMSEVAAKKKIRKARLLFEASAQSNPPSKDFVSLVITEQGIIWRKWKITLRGFTMGTAPVPQPQEEVMSITDFKCNDTLLDEVKRSFGENTFNHIERIIYGSNDPLSCTPEDLMVRICSMLDLQSVSQLSQVNKYLRSICMSDKLWSLLYIQHQGNPTPDICSLGNDISWKKVFYLNKLQLQKELSRRRALNPPKTAAAAGVRRSLMPNSIPFKGSTSDNVLTHRGSAPSTVAATSDTTLPKGSPTKNTVGGKSGARGSGQETFLTENA